MSTSSYALVTEVSKVLLQDPSDVVDDRAKVRADIGEFDAMMHVDAPATVTVEVTNLGQHIRAFRVQLLGVDPQYVTVEPETLELFPWERQTVTATITMPADQPSGRQRLAIEVVEDRPDAPPPALAAFSVEVAGQPSLSLSAEPATLEVGSQGTFLVHLVNTGNTELTVELLAQDAERLVEVVFEPTRPVLQPGERTVVKARAKGPRPWFGTPAVRVLDLRAASQGVEGVSAVAMLQRPRIGRRLIALLGLLLVITLFAYVITLSFGRVAELTEQNQALVQQGLGLDDASGSRTAPSSAQGRVTSSTGAPIDGATVRLYDEGNLVQPVRTTATDADGAYSFQVQPGTYLVEIEAAGFGVTWFDGAPTFEGATPITVEDEMVLDGIDMSLSGRPGTVQGVVVGADVVGALVQVRIPADAVRGSELEPVASVVAAIEIDGTGQFLLPQLATPATYEIAVSKVGFATEIRTVTLKPGEQRANIEILLRAGIGLIAGQVVDTAGVAVGGVDIVATDGSSTSTTRSLSGTDGAGEFVLRNLATPGTYTITFTAAGFFPESRTFTLEDQQQISDPVIILTRDAGSVVGHVRDGSGNTLGGVTIRVVGTDVERSTQSLTVGDIGSWSMDALPVPGTYTVSFTSPGYTTTALTIQLRPGAAAERSGVDAVLNPAEARASGYVKDTSGNRISGVEVTLEASGLTRRTRTSDVPVGRYVFDGIPPGAYTLTFRRAGSTPQTLLVDLSPGEQLELADVVLEAQAQLIGRVTRDGVNASGVGVLIYRAQDYPEGLVAETVTDGEGRFDLTGLDAPESYVIDFQVPAGGEVVESRSVFLQPNEVRDLGEVAL